MADTKLMAPMVGKIVSIDVEVGSPVGKNQAVVTMEAMKMKIGVMAPEAGVVKEIKVSVGQNVDVETLLAIIG